jgi:hypothetical protein
MGRIDAALRLPGPAPALAGRLDPDPQRGCRLARGRWLFDVVDDDSLPVDAVERLLETARGRRLEAVQGVIRHRLPDGTTQDEVPAAPDRLPLKGAVVHAHLRFFTREHVASAFGVPGGWFRGERMVRAGVRIGLVDDVTYEYYPSGLWLQNARGATPQA